MQSLPSHQACGEVSLDSNDPVAAKQDPIERTKNKGIPSNGAPCWSRKNTAETGPSTRGPLSISSSISGISALTLRFPTICCLVVTLFAVGVPSVSAAPELRAMLEIEVDVDTVTFIVIRTFSDQPALNARSKIDAQYGNQDGTVQTAEVSAFLRDLEQTNVEDDPSCLERIDAVLLDHKPPALLSRIAYQAEGLEGAVASAEPFIERQSITYTFEGTGPTPRVDVGLRHLNVELLAAPCTNEITIGEGARGPSRGNFSVHLKPATLPWRPETVEPSSVLALWDGSGFVAETAPERHFLSQTKFYIHFGSPLESPSRITDTGHVRAEPLSASVQPYENQTAAMWFVVSIASIGGWAAWRWRRTVLFALFARLERGDVMNHPARRALMSAVQHQPGSCIADLEVSCNLSHTTAIHHLRILERSNLVRLQRNAGRTLVHSAGPIPAAAGTYVSSIQLKVEDLVRARPGIVLSEVADELEMPRQLVRYHIRHLETVGRVSIRRDSRFRRHFASAGPEGAA